MTRIVHLLTEGDSPERARERKLRRELDVSARARTDGAENLPATGDSSLNDAQLQIVSRCERICDDIRQWLQRRLRRAAEAADRAEPTPEERAFSQALESARVALAKVRTDGRDRLVAARLSERRAHRERALFRRANKLSRAAEYPEVPVLAVAVVGLLLLLETGLNVRVFAEVNPLGWIGGGLSALTVSLINVAAGFLVIGHLGLRSLVHVSPARRFAGALAVLAGSGVVAVHNALFAHYRMLIEADPTADAVNAWATLRAAPLGFLAETDAWVLALAGVLAAGVAAWEGFSGVADRYPGYAGVDRRHRAAARAYDRAKADYRASVDRLVAATIRDVERRVAGVERRFRRVSRTMNRAHLDVRTAERSLAETERVCHRLLTQYRTENRRVRTTPPPGPFAELPRLAGARADLPAFDLEGKRGRLRDGVAAARAAARTTKTDLRGMAEREIDALFAMVDAVETEAEAQARRDKRDDRADALPASERVDGRPT